MNVEYGIPVRSRKSFEANTMRLIGLLLVIFLNVPVNENKMLPIYYETEAPAVDKNPVTANINDSQESNVKTIERPFDEGDSKEYTPKYDKGTTKDVKKPCAIVVLSNIQNPSMQSLLRKYRYDSNGMLIPGSVKYFIKLPKGLNSPSVLVPLNDKAFSPLGGFVRYYKEVPPIPQAW